VFFFFLHYQLDVVGLKFFVDSVYKNGVAEATVIVAHYRGASLARK